MHPLMLGAVAIWKAALVVGVGMVLGAARALWDVLRFEDEEEGET